MKKAQDQGERYGLSDQHPDNEERAQRKNTPGVDNSKIIRTIRRQGGHVVKDQQFIDS
jgi:hypothetical protein